MGTAISISWPALLAFVSFWSYGLFAAVHISSRAPNIALSLTLAGLTAALACLTRLLPKADFFEDRWEVDRKDVLVFFAFAILLGAGAGRELFFPLQVDQIFHAQYTHVHAFKGIRLLALKKGLFLDYGYRNLIWLTDFALLLSAATLLLVLKRLSLKFRFALIAIVFFALRVGIDTFGGNVDVHPSFRLFPIWLSTALLSSSALACRLPQFVALAALCVFLYRCSRRSLGEPLAFFFALGAGSLPLTLHVATLVEPSIWSAIAWTIVLFSLPSVFETQEEDIRKGLWFRLSAILAIGTMMRQPTFVAYVPFFLALFWREKRRLVGCWPVLIPCLLMLPQTLSAILLTTPATKGISARAMLPTVVAAIGDGTVFQIINNSIFGYGMILAALAFVPLPGFVPVLAAIRALWFSLGVGIFFSIVPNFWGTGRYQAEYVAPFVFFGMYQLLLGCRRWLPARVAGKTALTLIGGIIAANAWYYYSLPEMNRPLPGRDDVPPRESKILSQNYYNLDQAYEFIQRSGLAGKTYFTGYGYGNFTAVIHGYRVNEWLKEFAIINAVIQHKLSRGAGELAEIHSSDILAVPEIEVAIVDVLPALEGAENFLAALSAAGFQKVQEFKNLRHHKTVLVLQRHPKL